MNSIIKWLQLTRLRIDVNRYKHYNDPFLKLSFKSIRKRPVVKVLKITMGCIPLAYLVASQKKKNSDIMNIDFMWVNKHYITMDEESSYYQVLFETFMRWHVSPGIIGIYVNMVDDTQNEKLRRILTIFNFGFDFEKTMKLLSEAGFSAPYREKETIKSVIYTRTI